MQGTLDDLLQRVFSNFAPPARLSTTEWANTHRWLPSQQSAIPGKYNTKITPWIPGMLDALDDKSVRKVTCMKSAQVAWTDGVNNNYIGRRIHIDPCGMVILFPKEKTIRRFLDQKFVPMIKSSPALSPLVDVSTSRATGNRQDYKEFPGGFISLVASNAPDNVKSQSAPVLIIEEPDDCSQNVAGQGDSILLAEERVKTFANSKIISGGTPTISGVSTVEADYEASDQRKFYIPCPDCGESHVLEWDNVTWQTDESLADPVLANAVLDSARYACPHCGVMWTDFEKNRAVKKGEWRAEAEFKGTAGFYINELYSPFPGSILSRLVERYLKAQHKLKAGDDSSMIVFTNTCLGLGYKLESDAPEIEVLKARALDYEEKTIPFGGLILTAGVDFQHDRIAIVLRAWGRGEESWLVWWGEIYGNTMLINDPVWDELDSILFHGYQHESGAQLRVTAASLDSSDGQTSDAVYHYVRSRDKGGLMAIKGSSNTTRNVEIYTKPKAVYEQDDDQKTKAQKMGLQVNIVGTIKAKDLFFGRLKLDGDGPGRIHYYQDVRQDYYVQITAEVKVPHRTQKNTSVYQKKAGVPNEGTDCEIYALHAARYLKTHLMKADAWDAIQKTVLQADLFAGQPPQEAPLYQSPELVKFITKTRTKGRVISRGVD